MSLSMIRRPESFRPELVFTLAGRLLLIILVVEVLIMLAFRVIGLDTLPDMAAAILDGLLLTVFSAPLCYYWILLPALRERRKADERIGLLAAAIHNSGEAIIMTDRDATIIYVNPAFTAITGYSSDEAIGQNPRLLQSGKQSKVFYSRMWESLITTGRWQGKVWNKRKSGEIYHESLHVRAIRDAAGVTTHFIGTFTDTTEQEQLERMLQHAQKMDALGTLVGGVAHNFNNLIAGIAGKTYLALRRTEDPELQTHLQDIEQISDRASAIVKQLLMFSRDVEHEKQHVNLTMLFQSACRTARLGVPENIELVTDFCREDLFAYADAAQIEQVLINLINNARDACANRPHPRIRVSLQRLSWESCNQKDKFKICASEIACLQVEDNGTGIAQEDIDHIFEPFYSTKEAGKGTGLGLAMSYGAVESHGGIIDVQSTLGVGTIFMVGIPILNEVTATEAKESGVVVQATGKDQLVLVVDDEEIIRSTLSQILKSLGYQVVTAADGEEACQIFAGIADRVSLVVTDQIMPKMNGELALEKMRQRRPDLPAVIISGYSPEDTEINAITRSISKPFRVAGVSRVLNELLQSSTKKSPRQPKPSR